MYFKTVSVLFQATQNIQLEAPFMRLVGRYFFMKCGIFVELICLSIDSQWSKRSLESFVQIIKEWSYLVQPIVIRITNAEMNFVVVYMEYFSNLYKTIYNRCK